MAEHGGYPIVVRLPGNAASRLMDKVRQWFGDYFYRTPLGEYLAQPHHACTP